jgi:CubicO group peptidase (beta-lactamase class C family)
MRRLYCTLAYVVLFCMIFGSSVWAAALPSTVPEAVGLSSERLALIGNKLEADIAEGKIPGAVVLVARKGQIAYFEAFGMQDKEAGIPLKKDSLFRIYSMTKPFASVATMMLFEEGQLLLSDPVAKYIPAFKDVQVGVIEKDSEGKETVTTRNPKATMTVFHLLTHTSGLNYWFYPPKAIQKLYLEAGLNKPDQMTVEEMSDKLAAIPLLFDPGTQYRYSHSFDVLSRVVEVASGIPMNQFLQERIFDPLKMEDTGYHASEADLERLSFLTPKNPLYQDFTKPTKLFGGGSGTLSTAEDYARFAQMLLNGGQVDGQRFLSPETVAYMSSDQLGLLGNRTDPLYVPGVGYGGGFGFYVRVDAGRSPFIGSVGEFYKGGYGGTCFWIDPKKDVMAVLMVSAPAHRMYYRHLIKTMIYQAIVD